MQEFCLGPLFLALFDTFLWPLSMADMLKCYQFYTLENHLEQHIHTYFFLTAVNWLCLKSVWVKINKIQVNKI